MSYYFAKVLRSKILSLAGKNTNDKVDLEWIFARNCEGTKKLLKNTFFVTIRLWEEKGYGFSKGKEVGAPDAGKHCGHGIDRGDRGTGMVFWIIGNCKTL